MKKVISLMLAATMALGICACGTQGSANTSGSTNGTTGGGNTTSASTSATTTVTTNSFLVPNSENFNADGIVLQFAAVSDIHTGTNPNRVQNAFEQLKEAALLYTDKGLDAVIIAGDLTNDYGSNETVKAGEVTQVKNVYEAVFDPKEVPMIYSLGNHDHDFERNGGAGSTLQTFINVMGNVEGHTQYDVECSDAAHGSRHAVIGNYHFVFVEPITYGCTGADDTGAKYYEETKTWLDNTLKEITESAPNQYVFVITHPMLYGTVYGSDLLTSGIYWYTKDLDSILDKYPQVVTFGGHLHFPINDERSIMQTNFTSLGCGSVQYMAIENGGYDDMATATTMNDNNKVSSGYLVQVDDAGNVRIIRMDFQNETTIKEPFILETPKADKSHLTKYGKDRGNEENNSAPVLSNEAITIKDNAETEDDTLSVKLTFLAATDDDLVHHYLLTITEDGTVIETHKILTDYYRHGQVADMKKEYEVKLKAEYTRGGKYVVSLIAYDSWDAESNEVIYNYEPVLDTSKVTIPEVYADIDFANGTATDKNGKINIECVNATVSEGTFMFNGKSVTAPALNIKGGNQYAKLTFSQITDMDAFLQNDFAIELIYVNRSNSGTQNIISACGDKGLAVYESDGVPAFKACVSKTFKEVTAKEATSTDELVHVVVTYAPLSALFSIYVNGKQYKIVSSAYLKSQGNVLALGANITATGDIEGCASDLSIVDVKVYNAKFSQAQALVRYQNVLAEYNVN